jgi:hypothetical protein
MSLQALRNRVQKLEKSQRARTQRIVMKGGATKEELEKPTDVIRTVNDGGVVTWTSASSAELLKAADERIARLLADAAKPYYRR